MTPTKIPANGATTEAERESMQAEIDRLRASLRETEQRLAELQKQRDKYYEFTKLWIEQNCPMSDWDGFDPAEYTIPFDEKFLAEIKAQFKP